MSDTTNGYGERTAYGMAVKLAFKHYIEKHANPLNDERFWDDVKRFYQAYREKQEKVVGGQEK